MSKQILEAAVARRRIVATRGICSGDLCTPEKIKYFPLYILIITK